MGVVGRNKTIWGWERKQNFKRDERALVSGLGVTKSQLVNCEPVDLEPSPALV